MNDIVSDLDDFYNFDENAEGVWPNNWLYTPTQTILEGNLFMYASTNTNRAGIRFFLDQRCCCLGDYGHGVSKV